VRTRYELHEWGRGLEAVYRSVLTARPRAH
jgi:hypothetical protein